MGRKGVSKRKPKQSKVKSTQDVVSNSDRSTTFDTGKAENQPEQVTGKAKASPKGNKKR